MHHSLMDYLNPEANKLFDQWTFDAYKQAIGDELGKTVLGFRGDEPTSAQWRLQSLVAGDSRRVPKAQGL